MIQAPFLRNLVLRFIESRGSRLGPPTVRFPDRIISVEGEAFQVAGSWFSRLVRFVTGVSGFYLALPANVFGVVNFPNGASENMDGGVHEAPPGLYKVHFVDGHERSEALAPISEMTTDGENITLRVVLRYRVLDPRAVLRTEGPVETLIEHVETDVAQYIRTHVHSDIADSSLPNQNSSLLTFFVQRHNRRLPFSRGFSITGIEIKEFSRDDEYVEMRRRAGTEAMRNQLERQRVEYQQQMTIMKAQFEAEGEQVMVEHRAMLEKKSAEYRAEIQKLEAQHQKEKQAILNDVHLREIELDHKRRQLDDRRLDFTQFMQTIAQQFASTNPMSPAALKTLTDLFTAYQEDLDAELDAATGIRENGASAREERPGGSRPGGDRVETLKNTLLNLLNPRK